MPRFRYFAEECPAEGQLIEFADYSVPAAPGSDDPAEVYSPKLGCYLPGGRIITAALNLVRIEGAGRCWRPATGDVLPATLKPHPTRH